MSEDSSPLTRRSDIVSRRLAQLSAELSGTRPPTPLPELPERSEPPEPDHPHDPRSDDDEGGGRLGRVLPLPGRHAASVRLGTPQLAVVSVLVALGLLATAWWTVRSRSAGELVPPAVASGAVASGAVASGAVASGAVTSGAVTAAAGAPATAAPGLAPGSTSGTPGATSASEPGAAGSTGGAGTGSVVVDVAGKVRRPGIVVLPAGSRVVDALREAGGAAPRVDLLGLNQARVLVDGEQIVVGVELPAGVAASAASAPTNGGAGALVDLNAADQAGLEELPGVGPVTAAAILAWRTEHGGFTSVDELLEVDGIGDKTLADIAPHVTL